MEWNMVDEPPLRLIAIDPGSSAGGFVVMDYYIKSKTPVIIFEHTYTAIEAIDGFKHLRAYHTMQAIKRLAYGIYYKGLLELYDPYVTVCEDSYFKRLPQPFRVLSEHNSNYYNISLERDPHKDFILVKPSSVKVNMGVSSGSKDKEDMTRALLKRKDVQYGPGVDVSKFSEHTIDATCIALWFVDNMFKDL